MMIDEALSEADLDGAVAMVMERAELSRSAEVLGGCFVGTPAAVGVENGMVLVERQSRGRLAHMPHSGLARRTCSLQERDEDRHLCV